MKTLKIILKFFIGCILFGAVVAIVGYVYYSKDLPDVTELKDIRLQTPLQVLSAEGDLIASFGERRRIPLSYEHIPQYLKEAVIATEDSRFYEHHGVDPVGILRAVFIAAKSGGFSQGGSTITQQVAKNFFLTPERNIPRKIKEMILAIRMEKELNKQEILTLYLNKIYFGSRSYGVGAAAFTFFGKSAEELTLAEAALLAGLPNAPSAYNPISYPDRALTRRNWVLHRMLDQQYITQADYDKAVAEPLGVSYHTAKIAFSAPYAAEMARQYMYDKYGENAYSDGYVVYTTISKKDQVAANQAVRNNIFQYDMRHGYRGPEKVLWKADEAPWDDSKIEQALNNYMNYNDLYPAVVTAVSGNTATAMMAKGNSITIPFEGVSWARKYLTDDNQGPLPANIADVLKPGQQIWVRNINQVWWLSQIPNVNAALVSLNSETGAIKALVGGFDFTISKFNRVTQAIRQIGSNIKPFIYTAALDKGMTMATILNDAPIMRSSAGSDAWRPKNSPAQYAGPLRLRMGLALSKNVMMVRAVRAIGIDYVADYLERFGFPKQNISHNESLALGSAAFTPLQVARAYTVIANGGYLVTPFLINKIEYAEGDLIYQHVPEQICRECIDQFSVLNTQSNQFSMDNVENAAVSTDSEVPEASALSDNSGLILPDADRTFENYPTNISTGNLPAADNQPQQITTQPESAIAVPPVYVPHVISHELAFLMRTGLKTAVNGEPGSNWLATSWRARALGRSDVGGKTGTTNQSKDVWFSGFGDDLVTTVWMGFDDHRRQLGQAPTSINKPSAVVAEGGAKTANPIWVDYMKVALAGEPVKPDTVPDNIIEVTIDKQTGLLARPESEQMTEYFIKGTEPKVYAQKEIGTRVIDENGNASELF
ncbi:transglycosylase domain-containing protein [Utexia brackfieldae]|uniref:transglycosylase domain-containing protein n=1 Tax=Utexia brackfieldae TaxID=3074108 RepID=UPI00370D4B73